MCGLFSRTHGPKTAINAIGTTAEIFEYLPEEENAGFRIKAKARQRFRMLDSKYCCKWKAKVKILPEVRLSDPLENVKLQSLYRHRTSTVNRHRFVLFTNHINGKGVCFVVKSISHYITNYYFLS